MARAFFCVAVLCSVLPHNTALAASTASELGLLQWLMLPLSGATTHVIEPLVFWHARLMVVAWAFCLPLGILIARYFKVTPKQRWPEELDNKFWWRSHLFFQILGVGLMLCGLALVLLRRAHASVVFDFHVVLGWLLVAIALMQIAGGMLRGSKGGPTDVQMRGDHYDMTAWRVVFEFVHKALGYLALLLSVAVIVLGLLRADAPRWMLLVLGLWWMVLLSVFYYLQKRGLCLDTYQAIWGADKQHPGNQRQPIGWGVRRRDSQNF